MILYAFVLGAGLGLFGRQLLTMARPRRRVVRTARPYDWQNDASYATGGHEVAL